MLCCGQEACGGDLLNADLLQGFYLRDVLIEPAKGRVTSRQGSEHLPPKATEVLLCLARRSGELVTYEELLECAWGEHQGSREAVSHAVSEVRQALKDSKDDPEFIQTLPRRGYRLLVTPSSAGGDTGTVVLGARDSVDPHELGLFENLKQRGVLETALAYLILGWLLIQVADIVFSQLLLPQWAGTFVTVLVIAGFPIALALSWFLEIRAGNAVFDDLSPRDVRRRRFSRTYTSVVSALAIAAIAVFVYDQSIGLPVEEVPAPVAADPDSALPPVLDNSIAVLPFLNLDGSEESQIFANGLVDDVITQLSRVPGLLVSSRGDAFTLRPNSTSDNVRRRLRVAMYLEGSVESSGDKLRVIVQLINSETGFHMLSRRFDRPRDDFFEVRDEIRNLTVANVRVALPSLTRSSTLQSSDPPLLDAYLLYQRGVSVARRPVSSENADAATEWFDQALAVDPEYAAAYAGKCELYVRNFGHTFETSLIDVAQSACARALELNPNLDVVHDALGRLYITTGQLLDAEQSFKRAIEINPASSEAYTGLGEVYAAMNRPSEAEANLRQAIGLHPGDWSAYNELGNYLYRQGRFLEAAQQYQYVVGLDYANSDAHSNLGTAYMMAGELTTALSAFEKSLEIDSRANTYTNLGLLHYYLGQFDEAVANHRKAVEIEPNDYLARSNLGDALWISGDHDGARESYESALSMASEVFAVNPNDPFTMMDLAWLHALLGDSSEALELMGRAGTMAPGDPYTHYYDGLVRFRGGDTDGAIAALELAVDKGYPVALLAVEPHLESLRTHEKFREIISAD